MPNENSPSLFDLSASGGKKKQTPGVATSKKITRSTIANDELKKRLERVQKMHDQLIADMERIFEATALQRNFIIIVKIQPIFHLLNGKGVKSKKRGLSDKIIKNIEG